MIRWMRVRFWSAVMDDGCKSNKSLLGGTCGSAEVSPEQGVVVGIWHSCIYNLICNTSDKCIHVYTSVYNLICNTTPHEYTCMQQRCAYAVYTHACIFYLVSSVLDAQYLNLVACLIPQDQIEWIPRVCKIQLSSQDVCRIQHFGRVEVPLSYLIRPTTSLIWPPFQLLVSPSVGFSSLVSLLWFPS